jgi:hypothetical protein
MRLSLQTLSCVNSADKDADKELAARGAGERRFPLSPLRFHPLVVAKTALTGAAAERVDTRILRVLYKIESDGGRPLSRATDGCVHLFRRNGKALNRSKRCFSAIGWAKDDETGLAGGFSLCAGNG